MIEPISGGGAASEPQVESDLKGVTKILGHEGTKFLSYCGLEKILHKLHYVKNFSPLITHKSPKKAFTLAEVLITLTVIGVVAAITMSIIIPRIREHIFINRTIEAYKLLSEATEKMIHDYGDNIKDIGGETTNDTYMKYRELLPNYLKVIKTCEDGSAHLKCNSKNSGLYNLDDGSIYWWNAVVGNKTYVLSNGIHVILDRSSKADCTLNKNFTYVGQSRNGSYSSACGDIRVDVNGKKDPNIEGQDIQKFILVRDGIIPAGLPQDRVWTKNFDTSCYKNAQSYAAANSCSAWVIQNKNMDYIRCSGLSWNGKKTCKEN